MKGQRMCLGREKLYMCVSVCAPGLGTHTSQLGERLRAQLQTQRYLFPHRTNWDFGVGKGLAALPGPRDLPFV